MIEKKKVYRRYLVVAVDVEVDCSQTDQNPNDHYDEIMGEVAKELDYNVNFSGMIEAGQDASNAIEVPVRIVDTEVVGWLERDPT